VITLEVETKRLMDRLEAVRSKGIVYAVSMAMTWTAKAAQQAFAEVIKSNLDRPTPLTQRASRYKPANKNRTEYDVYVQDEASKGVPPVKYLRALVSGGYRANKRSENLLRAKGILPPGWQVQPGADAKRDAYGNLQGGGGRYVQILSQLKAFQERGHMMNATARSTKKAPATRAEYFVLYSLKTKTPLGVYTRRGRRGLAQILAFTPRRAKYQAQLPFVETIQKVYKNVFQKNLKEGLERMLIKVQSW
jgi:hypothetical protein